jgi:hypothetical protein
MRHEAREYLNNNATYIPAQDVLILELLIELLERPVARPLDFSGLAVAVDRLSTLATGISQISATPHQEGEQNE